MIVEVVKSGLYTTLQDRGRARYAHKGIPRGGAMDIESYDLCNLLLNNDPDEPVIECTMLGPSLLFHEIGSIVITGSDLSPTINKVPVSNNVVRRITKGDVLSFGRIQSGCRCFIGISGRWQVNRWKGSVSPLSYGNVLSENILRKGSSIKITSNELESRALVQVSREIPNREVHSLDVYKGPEYDLFSQSTIKQIGSETYRVHNDSNRMGYRLTGAKVRTDHLPPMISSGVLPGTIQITSSGLPIILCCDAQTVGGYPRIGILSQKSLNHMAHIKPGDQVQFRYIT